MEKTSIKFLKIEVEEACKSLLKRSQGGFKFGSWIDYPEPNNRLGSAGILISHFDGADAVKIEASYEYLSQLNVKIFVTINSYGSIGLSDQRFYASKDGLLTLRDWQRWGLNRYLIIAINDLKHI